MQEDKERRKYERAESPCVIEFQTRPGQVQEKGTAKRGMVIVEDVGAGGVSFNYNKNLQNGSLVDMKIGISSTTPPINCVGKIIRVKKIPDSPKLGIAIELTDISEREKEVINKLVENLCKQ